MKIGIIGSAAVGQRLSKAFKSEGHDVMLGTRNTSKEEVVKFKNENAGINIGTFKDTASFGEILVLATAGSVVEEAVKLAGIENFSNKVVIDTTNPIAPAPPVTTMFICGNDDDAKKTVTDILTAFGWETEDLGKTEAARAIEPICILWCIPGFLKNDWMHAYKVLRPA